MKKGNQMDELNKDQEIQIKVIIANATHCDTDQIEFSNITQRLVAVYDIMVKIPTLCMVSPINKVYRNHHYYKIRAEFDDGDLMAVGLDNMKEFFYMAKKER